MGRGLLAGHREGAAASLAPCLWIPPGLTMPPLCPGRLNRSPLAPLAQADSPALALIRAAGWRWLLTPVESRKDLLSVSREPGASLREPHGPGSLSVKIDLWLLLASCNFHAFDLGVRSSDCPHPALVCPAPLPPALGTVASRRPCSVPGSALLCQPGGQ